MPFSANAIPIRDAIAARRLPCRHDDVLVHSSRPRNSPYAVATMRVSKTERARETGLRMEAGAHANGILKRFPFEAVTLALVQALRCA
jgi:hypothetical protein